MKKVVYFNKTNIHLLDLIDNKDFSNYVCDLIRNDLNPSTQLEDDKLDEIINKLNEINDKLEKGAVITTVPITNEEEEDFDFGFMNDLS